jgi:GxxExxY protein
MSSSPQRAQSGTEATGVNQVTHAIIGAAMKVHSALGPGLLESAYEACLVHELRKAGFKVEQQVELPVNYDGIRIDLGYRIDLVVNDCVIVELKCVEKIAPVHEAQLISYMRLSKKNVGLLINFHVRHLKDGIKRFVEGTDWN